MAHARRISLALLVALAIHARELPRAGFLGVSVKTDAGGVRVLSLVEGGSAKSAGIQPNDLITDINDRKAGAQDDFVAFARSLRAGDTVTLKLQRGAETVVVKMPVKPRPFEHASDVDVTYGAVDSGNGLRRTILTTPKQDAHAAILYVTGIGCFSQESLDLQTADAKLLYALTRRGFATLRVEKSGIGDSEGPPCMSEAADLQNEINGYVAGLKALSKYDKVFVVGLSIGGVEAPLIAKQAPNVRGVVVINTVAKPFLDYLLETRRRQGENDAAIAREDVCNRRFLIEKQTPDASCKDQTTYPAPASYMREWAAMSPAANWKPVHVPVLVIYGTADMVAVPSDGPLLAKMTGGTAHAMEGMDHTMGKNGVFDEEIVGVIGDWLAAHS